MPNKYKSKPLTGKKPSTPKPGKPAVTYYAPPAPPPSLGRKDDSGKARFDLLPMVAIRFIFGVVSSLPVQSLTSRASLEKALSWLVVYAAAPETNYTERTNALAQAAIELFAARFPDSRSVIPPMALAAIVKVLEFGAFRAGKDGNGYGENNWQELEKGRQRYLAAAMRHIQDRLGGYGFDSQSDLPLEDHAATCVLFLLHLEIKGTGK